MNLFVPGRICLFGEHSDWAGSYRRVNAEIEKGHTIITGTNQGLHARVKPHPSRLIFRTVTDDGMERTFEAPMDLDELLREAQAGGFFSYAAGVAFQILTHYRVRGLEIDNHRTDLPVKKGLSSSAAACVLVARAFNRLYDLKMTTRGEMEFAYLGEITTPSRCGRMDQGCAFGNRPVLMTYDGDRMDVEELRVRKDLYLVVVDLGAGKDTREILNRLNHCYPFAENAVQRGVQNYLGPINADIVARSVEAIRLGDAPAVGLLMREAQENFDRFCIPACPSQLAAPALHRVLSYAPLQPLILGGKGVGSQGDGSAQLVVADREHQHKAMALIEAELGMRCLPLVISAAREVRKAVIPAAGFGTRLFPATKSVKKEFFPVPGPDGRMRPVILSIVEEALSAEVKEVAVVTQGRDKPLFEDFFAKAPAIENFNKLSAESQAESASILDVGRRVGFLTQDMQEGFGHAVYLGCDWVGEEPFLLLLGDHVYRSDTDVSCAAQVVEVHRRTGRSVVGLMPVPLAKVGHFGCVSGVWRPDGVLEITEFKEKPDPEYARERLVVDGLEPDTFLAVFGLYVLTPGIFRLLGDHIRRNIRESGEFQLTSCLDLLRQEEGVLGCLVQGRSFDVGRPEAYLATLNALADPGVSPAG